MLKIVGQPWWLIFALFIPFLNVIISIMITINLANKFDKSGWFAAGMIFFPYIFFPILAFGNAQYIED